MFILFSEFLIIDYEKKIQPIPFFPAYIICLKIVITELKVQFLKANCSNPGALLSEKMIISEFYMHFYIKSTVHLES